MTPDLSIRSSRPSSPCWPAVWAVCPLSSSRISPTRSARAGWAAAGGLMLAASVFNLIIPGVADAGINPVALGILLGALMMAGTSIWLDGKDVEFSGLSGANSRRALLVLITLTIHSFPEGIAIGVAFGSGAGGPGAGDDDRHRHPQHPRRGGRVAAAARSGGQRLEMRRLGHLLQPAAVDRRGAGLPGGDRLPSAVALRLWLRGRRHDLPGAERDDPGKPQHRAPAPGQRHPRAWRVFWA